MQIPRDTLIDLCHAPRHLGLRKIPVTIVHGFELGPVDRNTGSGQHTDLTAERNEPGTDLADRGAIVLAEVRNRLVVANQASRQPHDLHVAPRLAFQPAARLQVIEIAVNLELQENRGMIRRPPRRRRIDADKTKLAEIQFINKDIDHPNRIITPDPVVQAFRQKCRLVAIRTLDKSLHPIPPQRSPGEPYQRSRFHTWRNSGTL